MTFPGAFFAAIFRIANFKTDFHFLHFSNIYGILECFGAKHFMAFLDDPHFKISAVSRHD